jgi:uncharacterized protein
MMLTFVDSGAWYARVVPNDPHHVTVTNWHHAHVGDVITTDYVVDETLTLLRARGEEWRAIALGRSFFDLKAVTIHKIDDDDLAKAWGAFRDNPRRAWSFTDCTSKVVIERFHIKQALTFDQHFREFGNVTLVP